MPSTTHWGMPQSQQEAAHNLECTHRTAHFSAAAIIMASTEKKTKPDNWPSKEPSRNAGHTEPRPGGRADRLGRLRMAVEGTSGPSGQCACEEWTIPPDREESRPEGRKFLHTCIFAHFLGQHLILGESPNMSSLQFIARLIDRPL